jgi:hypothetical protein
MQPRDIIPADLEYWAPLHPMKVVFSADDPSFTECPALKTLDAEVDGRRSTVGGGTVVRVPWTLDPEEVEVLAAGGTIWLSTWGGLPPHMLEVAP